MVLEAQPSEIIDAVIVRVVVEVSDLALLHRVVSVKAEADTAPAPTPPQDGSGIVGSGLSPLFLPHDG